MVETGSYSVSLIRDLTQRLEQAFASDEELDDAHTLMGEIMDIIDMRDHAVVDLYLTAISQFCIVLNKISILMMRNEYEIAHGVLDSNIDRLTEVLEDGFPHFTPDELAQQTNQIACEINALTSEIAKKLSTFISVAAQSDNPM